MSDQERSRAARQLAERALVRLVREYGEVPEFVLLGGLVPGLLCSGATHRHIGTTDVDVQVDLEIQGGTVNGARLEAARTAVGFHPDTQKAMANDEGGPGVAARRVVEQFGEALVGATETALSELAANFTDGDAQGSVAYATTMQTMHPEMDLDVLANDGVAAVSLFLKDLLSTSDSQDVW